MMCALKISLTESIQRGLTHDDVLVMGPISIWVTLPWALSVKDFITYFLILIPAPSPPILRLWYYLIDKCRLFLYSISFPVITLSTTLCQKTLRLSQLIELSSTFLQANTFVGHVK